MPRVTLAKSHTHAGRHYPAGESIDVSEVERTWLVRHGVISAEPSPVTASPHSETSGDDHAAN